MEIKTKFDVGQIVYTLGSNAIIESEVLAVHVRSNYINTKDDTLKLHTFIDYTLEGFEERVSEQLVFGSKDDLVENLMK